MVQISQASLFQVTADEIISILNLTTKISSLAPGLAPAVCEILQPIAMIMLDEQIAQPSKYTQIQVREFNQEVAI